MKSIPEKLGLKHGHRIIIVNRPHSVELAIPESDIDEQKQLHGSFDLILVFVSSQGSLDAGFDEWKQHLNAEGKLWICWPKAHQLRPDLNIKSVIRIGYEHGMVESNAIRIDDEWAALKFTHPIEGKMYQNRYGILNEQAVIIRRGNGK